MEQARSSKPFLRRGRIGTEGRRYGHRSARMHTFLHTVIARRGFL